MKKTAAKKKALHELQAARAVVEATHPYALAGAMSVRTLEELDDDLRIGDGWDPEYATEQVEIEANPQEGAEVDDIEVDVQLGMLSRTFRFSGADAVDFGQFCDDVRAAAFADNPEEELMSVLDIYAGIRLAAMLKLAIEAGEMNDAKQLLGIILAA